MPHEKIAFVLSGGGARGALQVGALRALLEADIRPQLIAGTSAGALNAAAWAVYGINMPGLRRLEQAWLDAREAQLLPPRSWSLLTRALFARMRQAQQEHVRAFLIAHGLTPDLQFGDLQDVAVRLVAADVYAHKMRVYGDRPDDLVLEGVLACTALVPWMPLVRVDGHVLMDGGIVSNLPVQVALNWGATYIVALDIYDDRVVTAEQRGTTALLLHLTDTVSRRQVELELALAEAKGVSITYVHLKASRPTALWDFDNVDKLMQEGYEQMRVVLQKGISQEHRSGRLSRLMAWLCQGVR